MNSNTTNTSIKELKNQVINDLKKVREDFEAIKKSVTPGQMIDEALFANKEGLTINDSFTLLKSNPVGTSFLTLGTILLMENKNHMTYEGLARSQVDTVRTQVTNVVSKGKDAIHKVQGMVGKDTEVESAVEGMGQASPSSIKDTILQQKDEAVEGIATLANSAKDSIGHKMDEAKSSLHKGAEMVKGKALEAVDMARNLDPLTYLALGAGLGTLTGAALPISEVEQGVLSGAVEEKLTQFRMDLENALNSSVNILKNEFIGGMTEVNFHLF